MPFPKKMPGLEDHMGRIWKGLQSTVEGNKDHTNSKSLLQLIGFNQEVLRIMKIQVEGTDMTLKVPRSTPSIDKWRN